MIFIGDPLTPTQPTGFACFDLFGQSKCDLHNPVRASQRPALGLCWICQGGHCLLQQRCQPRAVVSHLLLCGESLTKPHGKEVELSDRGGRIQMTLYESLLCPALVRPISALLSYMSQYILVLCLYQLNFFFPVTWVAFLSAIECHPKQICV